jgi:hypothetical protein
VGVAPQDSAAAAERAPRPGALGACRSRQERGSTRQCGARISASACAHLSPVGTAQHSQQRGFAVLGCRRGGEEGRSLKMGGKVIGLAQGVVRLRALSRGRVTLPAAGGALGCEDGWAAGARARKARDCSLKRAKYACIPAVKSRMQSARACPSCSSTAHLSILECDGWPRAGKACHGRRGAAGQPGADVGRRAAGSPAGGRGGLGPRRGHEVEAARPAAGQRVLHGVVVVAAAALAGRVGGMQGRGEPAAFLRQQSS